MNNLREERLGEIRRNKYGTPMKIIRYDNSKNIWIKFLDEYGIEKHTDYQSFERGNTLNPYNKTICGIGYIGKTSTIDSDGKHKKSYICWKSMFVRCYSEKKQKKHSSYKMCIVCKEWYNYANFEKWYNENYYEIEDKKIQLDKDILKKGNKEYSPETCMFVPQRINSLFTKCNNARGELPIGVTYNKKMKKYEARLSMFRNNKTITKYLGLFITPEEAFQIYKAAKEAYIKEVAEEYKNRIPEKLYDVLINYEVEWDD